MTGPEVHRSLAISALGRDLKGRENEGLGLVCQDLAEEVQRRVSTLRLPGFRSALNRVIALAKALAVWNSGLLSITYSTNQRNVRSLCGGNGDDDRCGGAHSL